MSLPTSPKGEILLVDDMPDNSRLLTIMLNSRGYGVRSVMSGQMALQAVKSSPPDLILLDINMPVMDGYEVCQRLKANPQTVDIPVIFVSGLDGVFDKVKAFSVGGVDYITKPFQLPEILARVENQFTLRQLQKKLQQQNKQLQLEIKERKIAQKKLDESQRTLMTLLSNLPGMAYRSTPDHPWNFKFVSQGCLLLTGYPSDYFTNKDRIVYEILIHGQDYPLILSQIYAALEDHLAFQVTYRIITAQNQQKWIWEQGRGVYNDQGELESIEGFISDITHQKEAESALQEANKRLHDLATLDGLTQIANRRGFDEYWEKTWQNALLTQTYLTLILIDVDCFKLYNDTLGHQMGDQCLQKIAQTMQKTVNHSQQLVARYGGEEFAIILPNVNVKQAHEIAYKIQSAIHQLGLLHPSSKVSPYVTLSMGIGCLIPHPSISPNDVISMTDKLLYEVKAEGRNNYQLQEFSLYSEKSPYLGSS